MLFFRGAIPQKIAPHYFKGNNFSVEKQHQEPINLLDLKPRQNIAWEAGENGRIVLLVPKFRNKFLVTYLVPRLSKPNIRVKLDEFGSFVWNNCDGTTPVADIGKRMKAQFGESVEPVYDRIGAFLRKLEKEKFLIIEYNNKS